MTHTLPPPDTPTPCHPVTHARSLFEPAPDLVYLDAATYGLPPRQTVDALTRALQRWQSGEADWVEEWDRKGEVCRQLFAALIGGTDEEISLMPTASAGIGLIAAALPEGIEIVVPDDEFTSALYPLLVAERQRGIRVRRVPFCALATAIRPETGVVAFSLTRSQDGVTASLEEIVTAARQHGAQIVIDATHAIPFVPIEPWLAEIDYLVCHGYKHLLCPRGVAFLHVRKDHWGELLPWFANWRTSDPLYAHSYGGSLDDLAGDARRFDVSLAWHAWVGAEPSLALLVEWQACGILEEVHVLARRLAAGLGRPAPTASIVSVQVENAEAAERALAEMDVRCAARGGHIRLSPHVYNTEADIDQAVEALEHFMP